MSDDVTTYRDDELGAALRALPTPEHGPGFSRELRRRLAEERLAAPAAPARLPRRLARRASRRALAATAIAAAAILALALPFADRVLDVGGTEVASAAEVKAEVRASLASMGSLSGVLVLGCTERGCPSKAGERHWRFVLSSKGDMRYVGPTGDQTFTYDASAGIVRSAQRSASIGGDTIFYAERRGVAPGAPDLGPPGTMFDSFGAFVRALYAADDPRVREIVYDRRPAWRLEVDAVPDAIVPEFTGDRFEIVVDRETGIPVRVVELKNGAVLRDLRVEELAVDPELAPGTYRLGFSAGAEIMRTDDGFRRVGLDDVRAAVGYAPLVPAFVPEGYELAEVAVAERGGPTGREAGNPPSRMVVSLSYRRGFDQLVVTTRLARVPGAADAAWTDPVATGEGYLDDAERLVIGRGALEGAPAELVVVPRGTPHVWAETGELVVTVAGALGRDELVRVVESLERHG